MLKNTLIGLDKKKLRRWLLLFFFALAIPTAILIQQSYSRLKWETFHQHQVLAEELANRIDGQFLNLINKEEQRPFTDYSFLNVSGNETNNLLQRSPLSKFPPESDIPGLIGYFQVDSDGMLITPLVPKEGEYYGIDSTELEARISTQNQIQTILSQNHLVKKAPAKRKIVKSGGGVNLSPMDSLFGSRTSARNEPYDAGSSYETLNETTLEADTIQKNESQISFDELKNRPDNISPLQKKTYSFATDKTKKANNKQVRKERNILPETLNTELAENQTAMPAIRIRTFESTIDPFKFSQLDSGHFVLFRKVWLNKKRYTQGLLIKQNDFLEKIINSTFRKTSLSQMSDLLVSYQGKVLFRFSSLASGNYLNSKRELNGELLYQTRLSDPLSDLDLIFSVTQLPIGAGGKVILWLTFILGTILLAGFYFMYRLGMGQINLANQQQDFVSAVSHELKTPLTSIRMYGEMLREGWASEEKKKTYYDFIYDESERLTRLINNVLHLARMTRNKQIAELKKVSVAELMDDVKSKVSTQIKHAEFTLEIHCEAKHTSLNIDPDWFTQIMINLVDNALKFSAKAEQKKIDISCQQTSKGEITFSVRDYGPGINKAQMKKIFKLFYRTESELTRETVGTGIGLALVKQMTSNMGGKVDVLNKEPGAEFRLSFSII